MPCRRPQIMENTTRRYFEIDVIFFAAGDLMLLNTVRYQVRLLRVRCEIETAMESHDGSRATLIYWAEFTSFFETEPVCNAGVD